MAKLIEWVEFYNATSSFEEKALNIYIPEHKAIRINSVHINVCTRINGTGGGDDPKGIIAGVGVRAIEQAVLNAELIASETDIGMYTVVDRLVYGGNSASYARELRKQKDVVYALKPTIFVGANSTNVLSPLVDFIFEIDYDLVKLTTAMAMDIAVS